MDEAAVVVDHVGKQYHTYRRNVDRFFEAVSFRQRKLHEVFSAVEDVSFTLNKGESLGIIGLNGSGKSTLLKMITGVLQPSRGNIRVEGRVSALLELGAGFNREYTGIQNIILNGKIMGYTEAEIRRRIPEIAEFADIGRFLEQPVKVYSSGMFARLAFAVAINVDPDVLIVDEALSVGDVFFQSKCYHKFDEFQKKGKTILFVSHDLNSVVKYCSRCLLLDRGKQIAFGDCKEVVDIYRKILVHQYYDQDRQGNGQATESRSAVFSDMKKKMRLNPSFSEYGDHAITIEDFGIFNGRQELTGVIQKGEECTFAIRVRFHREVADPIVAITIKDLRGTELCGTNTLLEGCQVRDRGGDHTGVVRFRQKLLLQGGQYLICLGVTSYQGDELVVHQRLYDYCHLQILSQYNTVGIYDMASEVEYEA